MFGFVACNDDKICSVASTSNIDRNNNDSMDSYNHDSSNCISDYKMENSPNNIAIIVDDVLENEDENDGMKFTDRDDDHILQSSQIQDANLSQPSRERDRPWSVSQDATAADASVNTTIHALACYFNPFLVASKVADYTQHHHLVHTHGTICTWINNKSVWSSLCDINVQETILWTIFQIYGSNDGHSLLVKSIK
jgi:hypothetical protein